MRPIFFGLCLFAAGCSSQSLSSPTSPASMDLGSAGLATASSGSMQTQAQAAMNLPLRGTFTTFTDVPPPSAHATTEGTATHLRQFTGVLQATVNLDGTSTGTFTLTAASGEQLAGTFTGEGVFIPPSSARLTEVAAIESGTGRFAGATGTFTIVRFDNIDFATGLATGYGTFEGQISLRN